MKYAKHGRVFNGYDHIFAKLGQHLKCRDNMDVPTFENDTNDPPLFIGSRTIVDFLEDFRLFILLSYTLGYLVKVSV